MLHGTKDRYTYHKYIRFQNINRILDGKGFEFKICFVAKFKYLKINSWEILPEK